MNINVLLPNCMRLELLSETEGFHLAFIKMVGTIETVSKAILKLLINILKYSFKFEENYFAKGNCYLIRLHKSLQVVSIIIKLQSF